MIDVGRDLVWLLAILILFTACCTGLVTWGIWIEEAIW